MSTRAALHENIINALMAGKRTKTTPKLWIVMGRIGSGKSTLIASELAPKHAGAVVIDADRLWSKIPEYEGLAKEDWKTAGDRTYAEVRYLRDAALAEAAVRKLDIIGHHATVVHELLRIRAVHVQSPNGLYRTPLLLASYVNGFLVMAQYRIVDDL